MLEKRNKLNQNLNQYKSKIYSLGLTVIVGEFALKLDCKNPATTVDAWEIMRQCRWKNIGYLGNLIYLIMS